MKQLSERLSLRFLQVSKYVQNFISIQQQRLMDSIAFLATDCVMEGQISSTIEVELHLKSVRAPFS